MTDASPSLIEKLALEAIQVSFGDDAPGVLDLDRSDYTVPDDDTGRVLVTARIDRPTVGMDQQRRWLAQRLFARDTAKLDPARWYTLVFSYDPVPDSQVA